MTKKKKPSKRTPGTITTTPSGRKIKYLGTDTGTPEEDALITRMMKEAEADIAQRQAQRANNK